MLYSRYRDVARSEFASLSEMGADDLADLLVIHEKEIEHHREERKMHFGAMALVAVLAFLALNGAWFSGSMRPVSLALMGLLLALEVPYVFVYYRMENRLQRMNRQWFLIKDAIEKTRAAQSRQPAA